FVCATRSGRRWLSSERRLSVNEAHAEGEARASMISSRLSETCTGIHSRSDARASASRDASVKAAVLGVTECGVPSDDRIDEMSVEVRRAFLTHGSTTRCVDAGTTAPALWRGQPDSTSTTAIRAGAPPYPALPLFTAASSALANGIIDGISQRIYCISRLARRAGLMIS